MYSCVCLSTYVASDWKDKKPKEQEKRGDFLHRPFSKKLDKSLPSHKQPSASLITQIQSTRALLKDRKAAKPGFPDKGGSARGALQAICVQLRGRCVPHAGGCVGPWDRHTSRARGKAGLMHARQPENKQVQTAWCCPPVWAGFEKAEMGCTGLWEQRSGRKVLRE